MHKFLDGLSEDELIELAAQMQKGRPHVGARL